MRVPKMKAPSDSRHRSSSSKGCRKAASLSKVSVCSRNKIALRGVGAWLAAVATFAVFCAAASAPPSSRHVYGFIVSNTYQNCTSSVNATALFAPSPQVSGLSRPPAARCLLSAPPGRKAGGHTKGDSFSRPASGTGFKDGNHELGRAKIAVGGLWGAVCGCGGVQGIALHSSSRTPMTVGAHGSPTMWLQRRETVHSPPTVLRVRGGGWLPWNKKGAEEQEGAERRRRSSRSEGRRPRTRACSECERRTTQRDRCSNCLRKAGSSAEQPARSHGRRKGERSHDERDGDRHARERVERDGSSKGDSRSNAGARRGESDRWRDGQGGRSRSRGLDSRDRGSEGAESRSSPRASEADSGRKKDSWFRRLLPFGQQSGKQVQQDTIASAGLGPAGSKAQLSEDSCAQGSCAAGLAGLPAMHFVANPELYRQLQLERHAAKAAAMRRREGGITGWVRWFIKWGMALATLQPIVVTMFVTALKVLLFVRRVFFGLVDMEDERVFGDDAKSTTTFADVVGCDEAKKELEDIVAYLKDPAKFTRLGGKMPKGVLLWGPPGTGKTLLAKAIAGEAGVPFKYASGSEFEEMYVGVGARRVRDLFGAAKKAGPCIVFLDEIDAVGSKRAMTEQQSSRQTLNQILTELDGFNSADGLIVIGATNFPEVLDKALTRPGRFDRHIEVPNPDVKGRTDILTLHAKNVTMSDQVDLSTIARGTPGFSGAELASLINKAACKASKDGKVHVSMPDLEYAKDLILMGAERSAASFTLDNRRLTAFHEGGHALVATLTDGALPVHKATIMPRGHALGMVMQLPDQDMSSWSRRQMIAEMDVCMAGRAAEELIFGVGNITSGASSDLERATAIATSMVEKYGMSSKVGLVALSRGGKQRGGGGGQISEETLAVIDSEVRKLTDESYARALKMLKRHRRSLTALAEALLEAETLTGAQVREVVEESKAGRYTVISRLFGGLVPWISGRGGHYDRAAEKRHVAGLEARINELQEQVAALGKIAADMAEATAVINQHKQQQNRAARADKTAPAA